MASPFAVSGPHFAHAPSKAAKIRGEITTQLLKVAGVTDILERIHEKIEQSTASLISEKCNMAEVVHKMGQVVTLLGEAKSAILEGTQQSMASILPSKNPNKYNNFVSENMPKIKALHPKISNQKRFSIIAQMWKDTQESSSGGDAHASDQDFGHDEPAAIAAAPSAVPEVVVEVPAARRPGRPRRTPVAVDGN